MPMGGRGLTSPLYPGVYHCHGRTYSMWAPPSTPGPAQRHTMTDDAVLLDSVDAIRGGEGLFNRFRRLLRTENPLARELSHVSDAAVSRDAQQMSIRIAPSTPIHSEMEVALVFPVNDGDAPALRYAVTFPLYHDPSARFYNVFVPAYSSLYDLLTYPLLYLRGVGGFNMPAIRSRADRYPGVIESAASRQNLARFAVRGVHAVFTLHKWIKANIFQNPRLHYYGRLAQAWVLDMFSRDQHENLQFMSHDRTIQSFRVPVSAVEESAEAVAQCQRRVAIPHTVVGSQRFLADKIADGMAVVQALGTPTYFITFTANPYWPEVNSLLAQNADGSPAQSHLDRPDVVLRVFRDKLREFLRDLRTGRAFNQRSVFIFYVIEFQKRGLPHAHIAIRVAGHQPLSAAEIDAVISAEMPSTAACETGESPATCPCDDHRLYRIVEKQMLHTCFEGRCYKKGTPEHLQTCKYGVLSERRSLRIHATSHALLLQATHLRPALQLTSTLTTGELDTCAVPLPIARSSRTTVT